MFGRGVCLIRKLRGILCGALLNINSPISVYKTPMQPHKIKVLLHMVMLLVLTLDVFKGSKIVRYV